MPDHPISPAGHYGRPTPAKGTEHLGLSPRTSAMAHHSAMLFTSQPQLQSIFFEKHQCRTMARTEQALRPIIFSTKIYTFISTPNSHSPLFLPSPDFLPSAIHGSPKIYHKVKNWSWGSNPFGQGTNEEGSLITSPFHFCPDG